MSHKVYKIISVGMPRDHWAIFVETSSDQSGHLYHVTGSIATGMSFEEKENERPEISPTFADKVLLGTVLRADLQRLQQICRNVATPKKQFDGGKRLYPHEPLRRCQEWTDEVIQALEAAHVLQY